MGNKGERKYKEGTSLGHIHVKLPISSSLLAPLVSYFKVCG
jgi:hypothetical protein